VPIAIIVCFLVASFFMGFTPIFVGVFYLFLSCLAYLAYARDKKAAAEGTWRVAESTLHFLSFIGGWPGAIVAQQKLRHKTIKVVFRNVFWITVVLNSLGLIWLHTEQGSPSLHYFASVFKNFIENELASGNVKSTLLDMLSYRSSI